MKRPAKVEFYEARQSLLAEFGLSKYDSSTAYSWRLRAGNRQIILTPHETFLSLNNAVRSFKTVCKAMNAQTVFEVDGEASIKARAVRLLTR